MPIFSILGAVFSGGVSWLVKNPVLMAIAICASAIGLLVVSKNGEIRSYKNQLAAASVQHDRDVADLANARANEAQQASALSAQTASITALQQKAAEQNIMWQKLVAAAQATDVKMDKQLTIVKNYKPGPDLCASAEAMVRSAVK